MNNGEPERAPEKANAPAQPTPETELESIGMIIRAFVSAAGTPTGEMDLWTAVTKAAIPTGDGGPAHPGREDKR